MLALAFWVVLALILILIYPHYKFIFFVLLLCWLAGWIFVFRKLWHKLGFFLFLVLFISSIWGLLNLNPVQNWLVGKVTRTLSKSLNTTISIKHVDIGLFNKLIVDELLVKDQQKDTLLFAHNARLNISDWFFFKDKITLQYIGLTGAKINLSRSDSVWNYNFLVDYFGGNKKSTGNKSTLELDFKKLELNNVVINKLDGWLGQNMKVSLRNLSLNAEEINLNKQLININDINIVEPVFSIYDYAGKKPQKAITDNVATAIEAPVDSSYWQMSVKNLQITNGTFMSDQETGRAAYTDRFDGQHIKFYDINAGIQQVRWLNDSLTAGIYLSAKEQSGFKINKLQSILKVTSKMMEFNELNIETDRSRIGNYYAMRYKDFNADMGNFMHQVKLEGHFVDSKIHSDDIGYFAPEVKSWRRLISFDGNAKGTIDNLSAKNMLIKTGKTSVNGDITMRGLPDINNTFIDFKSKNLQTSYSELTILIPPLKKVAPVQLNQLGNISFQGNFTGFLSDFVAFGNIQTSLGNLNADLNLKLPENGKPYYSGKISSAGLQLGKLLNNPNLGKIALNGKVKGSGFTIDKLNADFDGKIQELEFGGYPYKQINLKGNFKNNLFTGHLDVNDPNLVIETLDGTISLANKQPQYNFDAVLKKANFKNLKISQEEFTLSGLFSLDFVGSNIDDFIGSAKVYKAQLLQDTNKLSFDSLTLYSRLDGENKELSFESNELEGNINGKFEILELPEAFKFFLNRYYPSYIQKPAKNLSDQNFVFNIKTRHVDEYIKLIDKKLSGFDNAVFSGNLNLARNELNLNADVPFFAYDGKIFQHTILTGTGNRDSLNADISVGDIGITDSLHFPQTQLVLKAGNDISDIKLTTRAASNTLGNAELNARVQTLTDGVKVKFFPSTFILNNTLWNLEKNGEITVRKNYIEANDVRFNSGNQQILITTELDDLTDHTHLVAKLKNVSINDIMPLFLTEPRLEGIVTGTVNLKEPLGRQIIEYDTQLENFKFDNKVIGRLNLTGDVNTATGNVKITKADADGTLYKFNGSGNFNYKDSSLSQMAFDFTAERFDLSVLENYLGTVFSKMEGNANSKLKITGGKDHPYITGDVTITEGALTVDYTKCKYLFSNETIQFKPDIIDLGTMQLRDTLKNTGTVYGKIGHHFFNDFSFNGMRFETGKMLLLNTTRKDNSQFYGTVIGQAVMTLNGPLTDMRMNITGQPSSIDSSHIFIPTGNSQEIGKIDYIDFIEYGSKMEDEFKAKKTSNFLVNMNFNTNPACKIDVILDEALGDVIKGKGTGQLNISVGSREPLLIYGNYNIKEGEYTFNFQTFLKKYFTIKQGSIKWNGDPYLAQINIDAEYQAKNIDLSSLSPTLKQKSDVVIVAHLTGILNKPDISFDFVLPENNIEKDFIAAQKLEEIKNDKNEMLKQVASLLLLNTFISDNESFLNGDNTLALAANTIGQVLSAALTTTFSKFLQKALNDNTITSYIDLSSSLDLNNTAAQLQGAAKFGITKRYFNNKLIISFGGSLDYNNPYLQNTNLLLTPDFTAEWLLSKDGKLRVVAFRRTNIDFTLGQRNRQGVSLTYQSDFNKFSELFGPPEDKRKRRLQEISPQLQ